MNKILAICTSPDKGGLELYFVKLTQYYHSYHQSVLPVCKKNSEIEKLVSPEAFLVNKINLFNIFFYAKKLAKIVDQSGIKVIHVSWTKDILLAVLTKKLCKAKVTLIYYRQMKITRMKNDFYHRFLYQNLDLILVITDKLMTEAKKFFPVPGMRIKKLTYGIQKLIPELNQKTKFLIISFSSDWLYTTKENKDTVIALNASGADVSFAEIKTDKGHDSFLVNEPEFLKTLKGFIDSMHIKFKNEKRI